WYAKAGGRHKRGACRTDRGSERGRIRDRRGRRGSDLTPVPRAAGRGGGQAGGRAGDRAEKIRSWRQGRRLALSAVFEAEFGQRTATAILERHLAETEGDPMAASLARQ